ncbi:MAG TPA: hypothetical protein VKG79_12455 [Bryobacteraceae bacterium]|nr:hypothetical protein [Bryobacteraceae bacterium]
MIKSAADFIMGVWTAPEVPLLIEYPLDIMEELRSLLCDELHRLSRGGGDVAGVLFGVSRGAAIRIMTWRTITRQAGEEQSQRMSRHDRAEMVRVLGMAASDPAMQGYEPLGWFVSHTDGGTGLTPSDIDLFENFFPNSWQVTLLMRRGPGGTARAGFFVREQDGSLRPDASYRELFVQPVRRVPGAAGARSPLSAVTTAQEAPQPERPAFVAAPTEHPAEPDPSIAAAPISLAEEEQPALLTSATSFPPLAAESSPEPEADAPVEESVRAAIDEPAPFIPEAPQEPPPAPTPIAARPAPALSIVEPPKTLRAVAPIEKLPAEKLPAVKAAAAAPPAEKLPADAPPSETPSFTMQTSSFGGARWLWIGLGLLALVLIIFLVTQRTASPAAASFGLRAAAMGDSIEISWDRDSTPVWNGQRASIKIQDGPDTKQLSLSSDQLHAGKTMYARETPDVAIEMIIYDAAGHDSHEFARFIAPAPYAPSSSQPQSNDANKLRAERDNLASQVEKLKADVRKEAARADQAEDLVRILENRLKIDDTRGRSQSQK